MWRGDTLFIWCDGENLERCTALDFSGETLAITVFNADGSELFDIKNPAMQRLKAALKACLEE